MSITTIEKYFSERLKDKIRDCLKNNNLESILIEWIISGNEKEKLDTYHIIKNLDYVIDKLNVVKFPISSKMMKKNIIKMIHDILENPIYNFDNEISMNHIETRSWLISCMCLCCMDVEDIKKNLEYLTQCFENDMDEMTQLYSIDGICKCIDNKIPNYYNELITFFDKNMICSNENEDEDINVCEFIKNYQICAMLWFIKNKNIQQFENYNKIIALYEKKITKLFNSKDIRTISELLYVYGCIPIENYVDNIIELLEQTLKKEKKQKLLKFNLIYYLNLIKACTGIRYINNELLIKKKEDIAHLLFRFLKVFRNYNDRVWNLMIIKILSCLRKYRQILCNNIIIDDLHSELLHDNHNIVTSACKTLHKFYQINNATNMILEGASKEVMKMGSTANSSTIIALSNSLKWMNNKDTAVLEALEDRMYRGETETIRTLAQKLISEMGGANAIKKLEVRKMLKDSYSDRISKAQKDVENMFHTTIIDAKRGFNISMIMEILLFICGLSLIMVSGYMAVFNGAQSSKHWIGTASTGGGGFLGILYSLFVSKPREKVKENVTHLMFLKIIFLGYLRELNQVDQCFNHYILDEKSIICPEHISIFNGNIDTIMTHCLQLLNMMNDESNNYIKVTNNNKAINNDIEPAYYNIPLSQIPPLSLTSTKSEQPISPKNNSMYDKNKDELTKTKSRKNLHSNSLGLSNFLGNKYENNINDLRKTQKNKMSNMQDVIDKNGIIEMGTLNSTKEFVKKI